LVATNRLLARTSRAHATFVATAIALSIAEAVTLSAVWRHHAGSGTAKAAATFWILTALGYFLTPILQRLEATPSGAARTVAGLDGVDVVATREPAPEDVVVTTDRAHLVVTGPAGRVALDRGEA